MEVNVTSELLHRLAKPVRKLERVAKNTEFTWRYGFNLGPTLRFRFHQPVLVSEAARVLASLNRDGVALTSVAALLGPTSSFDDLSADVARLQKSLHDQIAGARSLAATSEIEIGKKTFLLQYLDRNPALDPESIYARFALQPNIWQIANAYVGMLTRMRACNVWHNFPSQAQPRESQLWHRDPEGLYIVKVFVYLSDVDEGAGPFTYAPGTHGKGRVRQKPHYILEGDTKRSTDAQMAAVVPCDNWVTCTGPRGTIVFADTRGYHKGGLSRERDRVLYVCMFTS
jgi:hypothetical protein